MTAFKWGILGAAKFAREHMGPAIHLARGNCLAGLATRDVAKAEPFSQLAPGLRVFDTYQDLVAAPDIDAVYIPLPNSLHIEWTLRALDAGKHVLCEKPLAMQAHEFDAVIAKRDETGLMAAEAFMIVHHPQFHRARDIVQSGEIGALKHVDAVFTYDNASDAGNIRNHANTGGGGMPDIGVYVIGAVRFVTGQEPRAIPYAKVERENGVDTYAHFVADYDGFDVNSTVSMRLQPRQEVVFHGKNGVLRMTCPFNPLSYDQAELIVETQTTERRIERFAGVNHYVLQVEAFADAARTGGDFACPLEFSQGTQTSIDAVFSAAS